MTSLALIADIGGTNTRFALSAGAGDLTALLTLETAGFARFEDAAGEYLKSAGSDARPTRAILAVAGPVIDGRVRLTNADWTIDAATAAAALDLPEGVELLNDFAAIAYSLPHLGAGDLRPLGAWNPDPRAAKAVLGPGTGLGVGALVPARSGGWQAVAGEGGHATLAASTDEEADVVAALRRRFGHVSAERVVSGPGLAALDRALAGEAASERDPADIVQAAWNGEPAAVRAVRLFVDFLASVSGDLALIYGATGGVYLAGGIPARLGELLDPVRFRQRFEAKGRFAALLGGIPTAVVVRDNPGLLGLSALV